METFLGGPLLVELHSFGALRLQFRLPQDATFAELYHSCEADLLDLLDLRWTYVGPLAVEVVSFFGMLMLDFFRDECWNWQQQKIPGI